MYKFDLDLKLKIYLFLKVSKHFYLIKLCIPVPNISIYFVYFGLILKNLTSTGTDLLYIGNIYKLFYLLKHFEMFTE